MEALKCRGTVAKTWSGERSSYVEFLMIHDSCPLGPEVPPSRPERPMVKGLSPRTYAQIGNVCLDEGPSARSILTPAR